jgi:FG-GAP repeat
MRNKKIALVSVFAILLYLCSATPAYCQIGFSSPVNYPVGIGPSAVVAADFNGDGKLDLAVANSGTTVAEIRLVLTPMTTLVASPARTADRPGLKRSATMPLETSARTARFRFSPRIHISPIA